MNMKHSFKIIAISLFMLAFITSTESRAAKYPKKKPPISQMMLGGTTDVKAEPKAEATPAAVSDTQPAKESEKK